MGTAVVSAEQRRVAVTRDEGAEGPLASALAAVGLEPLACPVVREAPGPEPERLARAARELERYDWLIVASVRGLVALMAARAQAPLPGALRTAAVGASTARALERHGAHAPLTAPEPGAAALIEALRDADRWPGRRALLPRAASGGREPAEALRGWGAHADEIAAYATLEREPAEVAARWRSLAPDAVVVASPSAARALVRAVGARELAAVVVALGPTTLAALDELGVGALAAPSADFTAVAAFLARTLATHRAPHDGAGPGAVGAFRRRSA
ncbi:MAG TPA: uroporphyrinogen-III synthase [Candidatus Acidoferrales bacterium]|nr:uroporphyrinogen-III synthase [Candidatus Acidoferrales bacterium]